MLDWLDWRLVLFVYLPILLYFILKIELKAVTERIAYVFSDKIENENKTKNSSDMFWNRFISEMKLLFNVFIPLWNIIIVIVLVVSFRRVTLERLQKAEIEALAQIDSLDT